ncbi:hypothetical protein [Sulfurimonas sp.]|uniref:hypothetical protein n=1 Tax=Sulfurimonas sp. TaxID=2022749 RepID=UPI002605B094|nr:hypothetical protein [Sulfurimonas sp.]MDD3856371.1 hypothetical protein [Sulfurimonas sp.]
MSGKNIYMELGDGSEFESLKKTETAAKDFAKEEIKDFALDEAFESLFSKIEILDISGGMVNITMPLQVLKLLSKFSELLNQQETEISR